MNRSKFFIDFRSDFMLNWSSFCVTRHSDLTNNVKMMWKFDSQVSEKRCHRSFSVKDFTPINCCFPDLGNLCQLDAITLACFLLRLVFGSFGSLNLSTYKKFELVIFPSNLSPWTLSRILCRDHTLNFYIMMSG